MIRNRKIKWVLLVSSFLLFLFQALIIGIAEPRGYILLYDWIVYLVNYTIIVMILLIYIQNSFIRWTVRMTAVIVVVSTTVFLVYKGDVHLVVDRSEGGRHEMILKEYSSRKQETISLKRVAWVFGKQTDVLTGSSDYKTLKKDTYKIEWHFGDTAVITYQASPDKNSLQQEVVNFRPSSYVSYQNAVVGLMGEWVDRNQPEHTLQAEGSQFVYARDGELFYYRAVDAEQHGIFAVTLKGYEQNPSLTIVLSPEAEFGDNNLIDGSITIHPVSLERVDKAVFERE
ncbi:hypothetical protein P6709_11130 [Jeotgalibacillus sp. ET6]|uniref:hypothetical protein n=1 Tax=Jeotgalibacillus sp. ET6 TaxID=3037260 RepID=UPI0024188C82|nr:hypothetical protein [Jeotgalibacillus sp. ET6]MDG5472308.1 hypothetical protein [Jeotgalibacillus sp. ET6]